ncbi:MAG: sugar phosphate isomerase/epimerase [Planctomycetota bacterium]|nr:sugar phosphate isomerase/epimerase [Planctomycetota bacterium]
MKFAICNETYQSDRGWTLETTCAHAAEVGYEGLELAPFTLAQDPSSMTAADAKRIGETVRAAGLEVTGLHWLLLEPKGLHLTTPDDAVRARTVGFVQHLARLCADMQGEVLVWGSPAQRSLDDGWDRAEATRRAADAVREICAVAGEVGVTVAMEPLPPSYTNFLSSAAEGRDFVKLVDHPACRLHLDVNAMSYESEPIDAVIRASAADLHYFHANDPCLLGPGMGAVDYAPIRAALEDVGYDGWLSVEVFDYEPGAERIARESLEYLRSMFGTAAAS